MGLENESFSLIVTSAGAMGMHLVLCMRFAYRMTIPTYVAPDKMSDGWWIFRAVETL